MSDNFNLKAKSYLKKLCVDIPERPVGSDGNRLAVQFFEKEISSLGWDTELKTFDAIDWSDGGALLQVKNEKFEVFVSPYSLGCDVGAELVQVSSIRELENLNAKDKIILLHGDIAKEQLMPKNFIFYNPEEHQRIVSFLEKSNCLAIISATGRNATLAGGVYPFPLIEDGDFNIPSVFMTEEEGKKLLAYNNQVVRLKSFSKRIPGKGSNVIARKGSYEGRRIVITAHIDAKKRTPGAIDNATGVTILLLVADLLKEYDGCNLIEIVALNGEDYYSVPGQMNYIMDNQGKFDSIKLNINIDGAGYLEGKSAFSFYGVTEEVEKSILKTIDKYPGIKKGVEWPQGDHSIFVQQGVPAIAVSSEWFTENINSQEITHTPKDNIEIVDCDKIAEVAEAIKSIIDQIERN